LTQISVFVGFDFYEIVKIWELYRVFGGFRFWLFIVAPAQSCIHRVTVT